MVKKSTSTPDIMQVARIRLNTVFVQGLNDKIEQMKTDLIVQSTNVNNLAHIQLKVRLLVTYFTLFLVGEIEKSNICTALEGYIISLF